MGSMSSPSPGTYYYVQSRISKPAHTFTRSSLPLCQHRYDAKCSDKKTRRLTILKSNELAIIGAIFNLGGKKPDYLEPSYQELYLNF